MSYVCMMCEDPQAPVTQLHTSLITGMTLPTCTACVPTALIGALAAELAVDSGKLYDVVRKFADREAKAAEKAAQAAQAAADTPAEGTSVPADGQAATGVAP